MSDSELPETPKPKEKEKVPRKKQFERGEPDHPLTPTKFRMLLHVADYSLLTVVQMSKIMGLSYKATADHMKNLWNLKLVDRVFAQRSAFVDGPNHPSHAFGRGPTMYKVSPAGVKLLIQSKTFSKEDIGDVKDYGEYTEYFLAHEIGIQDFRIWLEQATRYYGHAGGLYRWKNTTKHVLGYVVPDAWFIYNFPQSSLFGFVEVDKGTERANVWEGKFRNYARLFQEPTLLEFTEGRDPILLITTPTASRRDLINSVLTACLVNNPDLIPLLTDKFWITEKSTLDNVDLNAPVWRLPGHEDLMPLVSQEVL